MLVTVLGTPFGPSQAAPQDRTPTSEAGGSAAASPTSLLALLGSLFGGTDTSSWSRAPSRVLAQAYPTGQAYVVVANSIKVINTATNQVTTTLTNTQLGVGAFEGITAIVA